MSLDSQRVGSWRVQFRELDLTTLIQDLQCNHVAFLGWEDALYKSFNVSESPLKRLLELARIARKE
jgi:hypothetical protein